MLRPPNPLKAERVSNNQHPRFVAEACRDLVRRDAYSLTAHTIARYVIGHYHEGPPDLAGKGAPWAIWRWARARLKYMREPRIEYVASLAYTFVNLSGDCDDLVVAMLTIAKTCGLESHVGWVWTGERTAHVFPVVSIDWAGAKQLVNIDWFRSSGPSLQMPPGLDRGGLLRC